MKKKFLALTLALTFVIAILPSSVIAEGNNFETWYVGASALNLRPNPNSNDESITVFPFETELSVIGVDSTGLWWEVYDGEHQGYVYSAYLVNEKGKRATYTASNGVSYTSKIPLGNFKITGYTPNPAENAGYTTTCTGADLWSNVGKIVATDHNVIPLHSWIEIEGLGVYQVLDSGVGGRVIDVLTYSKRESDDITGTRAVYLLK